MCWNRSTVSLTLILAGVVLYAMPAEAQSMFGSDGRSSSGGGIRLLAIGISTGLGFAVGWLLSDSGKDARLVVGGITLLVVGVVVLISDNALGWGMAAIGSILGFAIALGWWVRAGLKSLGEVPTTFGSSRWATAQDLEDNEIFGDDGICVGEFFHQDEEEDYIISYKGDRHLLTVAPTRSGKGTTQIIPNLLTYEGSVLVIDPKGENAMITAKRRKDMGQDVHIVDPWGITNVEGTQSSSFNPLDWLNMRDRDIAENAMILADALIVGENHSDSFWNEEAKALLQGLILFVATDDGEDGHRHLGRVRELLLYGREKQQELFKIMEDSPQPIVASTGSRCLQKEDKLLANVLASAQAQTHFLDSSSLKDNLMSSNFKFEDLKARRMTIYLVLPADRLNTFGRWLRLLVQQAVTVNARNIDIQPKKPVLFVLDEFAALGRLNMIEQAYGLMAGFGIQLWAIVQDLNQLERVYGTGWQSFISNAGMINYFGSSDKMTSEYFSSMCGETTVWNFSSAVSTALGTNSGTSGSSSTTMTNSDNRAASQRKLVYPDELMRMNKEQQIVFIENMHPLIAAKTPWYDDDDLKNLGVNWKPNKQVTDEGSAE